MDKLRENMSKTKIWAEPLAEQKNLKILMYHSNCMMKLIKK